MCLDLVIAIKQTDLEILGFPLRLPPTVGLILQHLLLGRNPTLEILVRKYVLAHKAQGGLDWTSVFIPTKKKF